ncbi:restriction endonuclease [Methylobacterium oxalidis]|uniref:restriction endonuclease n=1 Tax=Methylobacterium oxalidis TaxID=944322 RepID=UPI003316200B
MNIHANFSGQLSPSHARFIRLGPGGAWARACIAYGEIRFGSPEEPHELCLAGDWLGAREALIGEGGKSPSEASQCLRELREFYTLPADGCLWITFFEGRLWWAFAEAAIERVGEGEVGIVLRRTRDGWHDASLTGVPLTATTLSSRLTQVQAYQRTICKFGAADYLVRKINGIEEPAVLRAKAVHAEMIAAAEALIAGLHWADFEVLADLLLARSGWRRVSDLGKTQADIDLIIEQPATGERGFVQVKSRATQSVLDASIAAYRASGSYARMFFVCHSPTGTLSAVEPNVHLLIGSDLARRSVDAGLLDWLIERAG